MSEHHIHLLNNHCYINVLKADLNNPSETSLIIVSVHLTVLFYISSFSAFLLTESDT